MDSLREGRLTVLVVGVRLEASRVVVQRTSAMVWHDIRTWLHHTHTWQAKASQHGAGAGATVHPMSGERGNENEQVDEQEDEREREEGEQTVCVCPSAMEGQCWVGLHAFSFFLLCFIFFVHARPRLPYGGSVENMSRLPMTGT
jgi:hypothetical protein